jgi:Protein of unknown function (DUF3320)
MMRWPAVERVWLPEWLQRRDATVARLKEAVTQARDRVRSGQATFWQKVPEAARPVRAFAPLRQAPAPVRSFTEPQAPRLHPMVRIYREWKPGRLGDVTVLDELYMDHAKTRVRDAIIKAIEAEAPIHPDRLAKTVAGAFSLTKVNETRRLSIQRLVPLDYQRKEGEGFYWPKDVDPRTWRIVRRPRNGTTRPLEEVCLIEIGNAMIVVAEQTGGIEADDLKREALHMLGGSRITEGVRTRLNHALDLALKRGVLRQNGSGVITPTG